MCLLASECVDSALVVNNISFKWLLLIKYIGVKVVNNFVKFGAECLLLLLFGGCPWDVDVDLVLRQS